MNILLDLKRIYNENDSYFEKTDKEIIYYFYKSLELLDLPIIDLEIIHINYGSDESSRFYPIHYKIMCCNMADNLIVEHPYDFKLKTNLEYTLYFLFHEIGHYWHKYKHTNHFEQFLIYYKCPEECYNKEEYINQHFERIADKVAKILYRKLIDNNFP